MKVYAVDFDGTLCENAYPGIGDEKVEIISYVKNLVAEGNRIVLWTCRSGIDLDAAISWCAERGITFTAINENLPEAIEQFGYDSRKIGAYRYIDDRCIPVSQIIKEYHMEKEAMQLKMEIRADGLHISGYVNVPGRQSRPVITGKGQKVIEVIEQRAFDRAIKKAANIPMTVDHNQNRIVAQTQDTTLTLAEDQIGLRAEALITDDEVIKAGKAGKIKGWSFGMKNIIDELEERTGELPLRRVKDFILDHITLVINRTPAYAATSVELRADDEDPVELELRTAESDIKVEDKSESQKAYLSKYQYRINKIKAGK